MSAYPEEQAIEIEPDSNTFTAIGSKGQTNRRVPELSGNDETSTIPICSTVEDVVSTDDAALVVNVLVPTSSTGAAVMPNSLPTTIDTNVNQETQTVTFDTSTTLPQPVVISCTAITDACTGETLHMILMSNESNSKLSEKSSVTVSGLGYIHFHTLQESKVSLQTNQGKAFELNRSSIGTMWCFQGLPSALRWWHLDNKGTMSLIHVTRTEGSVEVARLTGTRLEFKHANSKAKNLGMK